MVEITLAWDLPILSKTNAATNLLLQSIWGLRAYNRNSAYLTLPRFKLPPMILIGPKFGL